jgi:hypothetical protein
MSFIKVGISTVKNLVKYGQAKNIVAKAAQAAEQVTKEATTGGTKVFTDSVNNVVKMERNITYAGKEALASLEVFPDGTRKLSITGGGDNPIWRTTTVTRNPKSNIFGGDEIVINKKTSKYWCYQNKQTLTKQYSPEGVLEHKELNFAHNSGNGLNDYTHYATQDKLYNEVNLTSSAEDMYKVKPENNHNIMHSLDGEANYGKNTISKYEKTIAEQKQAEIAAAEKAAEAEKEAAANLAKLKAEAPRLNTGKVLGRDLSSLKKTEISCKNGKTIRLYRDPDTNKLLVKTEDQGIGHKEWFYGSKADQIYLHQVGNERPYIVAKKGNYTQISGGPDKYMTGEGAFTLYNGEDASLRWFSSSCFHAQGNVKVNGNKYRVHDDRVYAPRYEISKADQALTNATKDAKSKTLDFDNLLQDCK